MGLRYNRPEGLPSWAPNFGKSSGGSGLLTVLPLKDQASFGNTHVRMKETDS